MISSLFLFGGIQNGALLVIAQGKLCLLLHIHNDWNFPISNFYRNFRNLTFKVVRKSGIQLAQMVLESWASLPMANAGLALAAV